MFAGRLLHLEDIAECASMGKRAVSELLATGAVLAWSAELEEDKARWVEGCVHTYHTDQQKASKHTVVLFPDLHVVSPDPTLS